MQQLLGKRARRIISSVDDMAGSSASKRTRPVKVSFMGERQEANEEPRKEVEGEARTEWDSSHDRVHSLACISPVSLSDLRCTVDLE